MAAGWSKGGRKSVVRTSLGYLLLIDDRYSEHGTF